MGFIDSLIVSRLDTNRTISSLIKLARDQDNLIKRILRASLPLISMYQPAAPFVTCGLLGAKVKSVLSEESTKKEKCLKTAFIAANIAGAIFFPKFHSVALTGAELVSNLQKLQNHIREPNLKAAAYELLCIAHNLLNLGLAFKTGPELLFLSLLTQAAKELCKALRECDKDHGIEALLNVFLALIRLQGAGIQGEIAYRNHYGKELTQEALDTILDELQETPVIETPVIETPVIEEPVIEEQIEIEIAPPPLPVIFPVSSPARPRSPLETLATLIARLDALIEKLRLFLKKLKAEEKTSFTDELKRKGYKNNLKDLVVEGRQFVRYRFDNLSFDNLIIHNTKISSSLFNEVNFRDCKINNVEINETSFIRNEFHNVLFNQCDLSASSLFRCMIENTNFINHCLLKDTEFNWSRLNNTVFSDADLTGAVFNDTRLTNVEFRLCNLFESTFFEAEAISSRIIDSNLKDTLLCDTKEQFSIEGGIPHEITRPVIGLHYNFKNKAPYTEQVLKAAKTQGIVLRVHNVEKDVDVKALEKEVTAQLERIDERSEEESIAQFILSRTSSNPEIRKVKNYAQKIMQTVDGFIVGGGLDIEPILYGKEKMPSTFTESTMAKTIQEFCLFYQANQYNTPVLTICRGTQSLNVYHGGTLHQKNVGHYGETSLIRIKPEMANQKIGQIVYNMLQGSQLDVLCMHNQGCDKIGKDLNVLMEHEGIAELLVSDVKSNLEYPVFIGTQFHPEVAVMENKSDLFQKNIRFFENLRERAMMNKNSKS